MTVQNYYPIPQTNYYSAPYSQVTSPVTTNTSSYTTSPYATGDTYNTSSTGDTTDWMNTKASAGKRFFNGIGNAFGRIADWMGFGTISHYAKRNFDYYDANKSNSLDTNEFTTVSQLIGQSFQQVDSNTNQQISLGEFKKVIGDMVRVTFKALDTNQDSFINYVEASAGGYVTMHGSQNSFARNDKNQDYLLSLKEFAGLINEVKLKQI